jgi:hypothetical protein
MKLPITIFDYRMSVNVIYPCFTHLQNKKETNKSFSLKINGFKQTQRKI